MKNIVVVVIVLCIITATTLFFVGKMNSEYLQYRYEKFHFDLLRILFGGESGSDYYSLALAIKNNDIKYCDRDKGITRSDCINKFIVYTGEKNLCPFMVGLGREMTNDRCYRILAIGRSDYGYCQYISDEDSKNKCVAELKKKELNPVPAKFPYLASVCSRSERLLDKYRCIANQVAKTGLIEECDKILDDSIRSKCYVYSVFIEKGLYKYDTGFFLD